MSTNDQLAFLRQMRDSDKVANATRDGEFHIARDVVYVIVESTVLAVNTKLGLGPRAHVDFLEQDGLSVVATKGRL